MIYQFIHLQFIQFINDIPVHRYTKTKIKANGGRLYINFWELNVLKDGVECQSFTIISIHSLLAYQNKYYLQYI